MTDNPEKNVNIPEAQTPPFRYYFVMSFFISSFFLILDGLYRSDAFLTRLSPISFVANGIFLWLAIFFLLMILSLLLWGIDALIRLIIFRKSKPSKTGEIKFINHISGFIYFSIFSYINILYLRLYLSSFIPGMMKNGQMIGIGKISSALLVAALFIYIFAARKFLHGGTLRTVVHRSFKPLLGVVIVFCLVFASVFLFTSKSKAAKTDSVAVNKKGKPHILFITLDNLRTASMSVYGYELKTTPFLEEFADECSVFDNAMGGSTQTLSSMPIIISGKYLRKKFPSPPSFYEKSLPKVLEESGYKKRCFVSQLSMNMFPRKLFSDFVILNDLKGDPVRSLSWLGKSRDTLLWLSYFFSGDEHFFNIYDIRDPRDLDFRRTETILPAAGDYIVRTLKESKEPVFIWGHFMKTHQPFNPPKIFKEHFTESYNPEFNKYNACVRYVDYELGNIVKRLKAEGLYENTMIIISSDHGCYFEAEFMANQINLGSPSRPYMRLSGPITNIPLIIHEPGQKSGRRISAIADQSDMAPTILDLAGITPPAEMDGESMVPYIRGQKEKSDKVKVTVPGEFFFMLNNLAFNQETELEYITFCAYIDHYAIEFAQRQTGNTGSDGKKKSSGDEDFPFELIGIYDITTDKKHDDDLIDMKGMKALTDMVLESPWMKYYGEIKGKQ